MDIAAWLQDLGLERYAQAFLGNHIDLRVLRSLTDDDLKELGVASLGHRKQLLEAIAALRAPAGQPAAGAEPGAAATTPRKAERRQLTVLFCDLVGSTELSARLDPEDLGAVMRTYQNCCAEVVRRWDGHVARYLGDGVLAYFGWPQAHEDDAERAVRAGLDLVAAVGRLTANEGEPLAARIGIATGRVVVGDRIGEGAASIWNRDLKYKLNAKGTGIVIRHVYRKVDSDPIELLPPTDPRYASTAESCIDLLFNPYPPETELPPQIGYCLGRCEQPAILNTGG